MNNVLKYKIGDLVILNEKFGKDCGKEVIIHSIKIDKKAKVIIDFYIKIV